MNAMKPSSSPQPAVQTFKHSNKFPFQFVPFTRLQIGVDFLTKMIRFEEDTFINLHLWDVAGQVIFREQSRSKTGANQRALNVPKFKHSKLASQDSTFSNRTLCCRSALAA